MVAITSNQPTFAPQSNSALPTAELRAVPEQERPINNQDNAVAAPQSTKPSTNENAQPQGNPSQQPTEAVSQAEQQLQRAAVESSATTPQPEANQEASQARTQEAPARDTPSQEAPVQETRTQETVPAGQTSAPAPTAEAAPTTSPGSAAALSTYQQVSSINDNRTQRVDSSDDQAIEASSTPLTIAPEKAEQASTERQVFGGAIDAANS